jgi:exosome complex exonuclease DIS3/RRP44
MVPSMSRARPIILDGRRLQMDLLENAAISDVIVPEVVLSEVQGRNKAVHGRLRLLVADKSRRFFVFSNEHHK